MFITVSLNQLHRQCPPFWGTLAATAGVVLVYFLTAYQGQKRGV